MIQYLECGICSGYDLPEVEKDDHSLRLIPVPVEGTVQALGRGFPCPARNADLGRNDRIPHAVCKKGFRDPDLNTAFLQVCRSVEFNLILQGEIIRLGNVMKIRLIDIIIRAGPKLPSRISRCQPLSFFSLPLFISQNLRCRPGFFLRKLRQGFQRHGLLISIALLLPILLSICILRNVCRVPAFLPGFVIFAPCIRFFPVQLHRSGQDFTSILRSGIRL